MVSRHIDQNVTTTTRNILADVTLWSYRFKKTDQKMAADLVMQSFCVCCLLVYSLLDYTKKNLPIPYQKAQLFMAEGDPPRPSF
jgi:hypothetical protein